MGSDAGVRAFLALEIPQGVKDRIEAEMNTLRRSLPKARWVRPAGLHLTLKFLGTVEEHRLTALAEAVGMAAAEAPPVRVALSGAGFFPSPRRARVAWIGGAADGAPELAEAVERAAGSLGFERERRPWGLHLTLARLRSPWPAEATEAFLSWGSDFRAEHFVCRELVLFESCLKPDGAVYAPLERLALGGAGEDRLA